MVWEKTGEGESGEGGRNLFIQSVGTGGGYRGIPEGKSFHVGSESKSIQGFITGL